MPASATAPTPPGSCLRCRGTRIDSDPDAPTGIAVAPKQELHLHFHGVTAEDVAAIIARQRVGE